MALDHNAADIKLGKSMQNRQLFTFFVENMMFGLDVENVLMLGQDSNEIQRLPIEEQGFCGVVKVQGNLVPVLDYAHRLGLLSGIDNKAVLLETFEALEQEHLDWLKELESCLESDKAFSKSLDPDGCDYGKWYKVFDTRDLDLKQLMLQFDQPHRQIHSLAEKILTLREVDKRDEAFELFHHEMQPHLRRLRVLFSRARDQIQNEMRPVLLYVTRDGKTPCYALMIDEINDVITYKQNEFQSSKTGPLSSIKQIQNVIEGIFTKDNHPDCLYFDIHKLTDIDQLMVKVS